MNSSCGNQKDALQFDGKTLGIGGNASLLAYIGETNEDIRERAAAAYALYQKCSINAAKGLLVTDW